MVVTVVRFGGAAIYFNERVNMYGKQVEQREQAAKLAVELVRQEIPFRYQFLIVTETYDFTSPDLRFEVFHNTFLRFDGV